MKKETKKDYNKLPVFSRRIKERRKDLKLTQLDLARLVWPDLLMNADKQTEDTKRKCIVGYENGKQPKDNEDYISLCNALGCDMGYLFGENECRTKDIQGVVNFTGLSEKTVTELSDFTSKLDGKDAAFINAIVEKGYLQRLSWAYDEMTSYFQLYKNSAARHKKLTDFVSAEGIIEDDSNLLTDESFMKAADYQQFSFHKFLVYDLFMQFLTESENG